MGSFSDDAVPPNPTDRRVTYLLARTANACALEANTALGPLGLDTRHYAVLSLLATSAAPSQRVIADTLRIDRATVVSLADDLERQHLVRRTQSSDDRRANRLELTEVGSQTLQRAHALMDDCEEMFMGPLAPAERRRLARSLTRLLEPGA